MDGEADSWHDNPMQAADVRWRIQGRCENGSAAHMLLKPHYLFTYNLCTICSKRTLLLHTIQIEYLSKYIFQIKPFSSMKLKIVIWQYERHLCQ